MQEELGLKLVTDGEYNRHSWHRDFMLKFENVRMMPSKLTVRFHTADGDRATQPADHAGDRQARAAERRRNLRRRLQVSGIDRAGDAEDHASVADGDAFPRRARGDRRRRLSRYRRVLRRSRAALPRGDRATSPRPAAAICRSTRSISPISAIRSCASRSPISARTRRRCRRPTPSCSTTRSEDRPPT